MEGMDNRTRKRSNAVVLTLVGVPLAAIGIANAFPGQTYKRNLYPDRAACERDYTPQQCEPGGGSGTTSSGGSSGSGGHSSGLWFHGPAYSADRGATSAGDPGPGRTGQITRTEVSTRGGFGAMGRGLRAIG
jgi:hypothetical protein